MTNPLDSIFKAKSVAIVGALEDQDTPGHIILRNLINSCFEGAIYPISSEDDTILWLKTHSNLRAIDDTIDLAVLACPIEDLPRAMEDAGKAGVKSAIIVSDEVEASNKWDMVQETLDKALLYHIRVLGPNSQGIIDTHNKLCASKSLITVRGSIAIISQSMTIGSAIAGWANDEGIGISGFASLGDKADVNELDLLEYFANDSNTNAICLYVDTIAEEAEFSKICAKIVKIKPIIMLKPTNTLELQHTEKNLVQCRDVTQFYDSTKVLAIGQPIDSSRIVVVTNSKGGGLLAVESIIKNELELGALIDLPQNADGEKYLQALQVIEPQSAGAIVCIFDDGVNGITEAFDSLSEICTTQLVCCYFGGRDLNTQLKLQRNGYPVFLTPERAVTAVRSLYHYGNILKRIEAD